MENNTPKNEESTSVTSNNETVAVTETTTVTSSSPTTSAASAFQPFQQLHEAVLAAVNSHNVGLPSSLFSAAVAAAAANSNVTIHPQPFDQPMEQQQQHHTVMTDADNAKKESIRASNRERKKKWRLHNEERNKDNDLRCRVNKRALKLYGPNDSVAKQQWVEEEFEKRRQKRIEKERRKHIVNNVLSVPDTNESSGVTSADNNNGLSSIVNNQMSAYYPPLPQIDNATAAKLLDFPSDLQRQLLEQLNSSMLALTNGIQQPAQTQDNTNAENQSITTNFTNESNANDDNNGTSVVDPVSVAAAAQAANEALQQVIAQGLSATATSASTTTSSNHNSPLPFTEETKEEEGAKTEGGETEVKDEAVKEEGAAAGGEKKPEYPMDAVLTLMQLNAGWRQ